jgi:hypothetical protein
MNWPNQAETYGQQAPAWSRVQAVPSSPSQVALTSAQPIATEAIS